MGCVESKATGSKEEFRRLNRPSGPAANGAPAAHSRLAAFLPTSGPLSAEEYWARLEIGATEAVELDGLRVRYAYVTQRGLYPEALDKANQDAVFVKQDFAGQAKQMLFGVFDGHGLLGTEAAQFAKARVPVNLAEHPRLEDAPEDAFREAMVWTNEQLHASAVDDSMSGTTAITCLLRGRQAFISNVGDSRAVIAERRGEALAAVALSRDQTPFRKDEAERVRKAGARVLTLDQIEGIKDPTVECWSNEEEDSGDPPRLWAQNGTYPGTAFTRSIGDALAEEIGVSAEPEVELRRVAECNPFLVLASDGVFEFLSDQSVVDMVSKFKDPQEAALCLVVESYHLWLSYETRTDDISAVVVMLETVDAPPPPGGPQMKRIRSGVGVQNGLSKGLSTVRSSVGSLAKGFGHPSYSQMDDGLDDPLVRPLSSNSIAEGSLASRSSRFLSDEERLPTPKRVFERQESRSRHQEAPPGSPKMSLPPNVLQMSDTMSTRDLLTTQ